MPKILFVGDPHIQPSNIEEATLLMSFIIETGKKEEVTDLVIAGDLFHTHAVIRMEVLNFWIEWSKKFSENFERTHLLCGNHDMKGDKQTEGNMSALDPLKGMYPNVYVWSHPGISQGLGFIPYTSNHEKFVEWTQELYKEGATRIFCHQTFDGSKYDNGFYAPDGIDQKLLPEFEEVVSGHIHTEQRIGNVFYPGTPKWDTLSDANEKKGIWISSKALDWKKIETGHVCSPIIKKQILEESFEEKDLEIEPNARVILELLGSSLWIAKISKKLKGKCRLIAKPTDSMERKKTAKVSKTIFEYLNSYQNIKSDKEKLKSYVESLCLQ